MNPVVGARGGGVEIEIGPYIREDLLRVRRGQEASRGSPAEAVQSARVPGQLAQSALLPELERLAGGGGQQTSPRLTGQMPDVRPMTGQRPRRLCMRDDSTLRIPDNRSEEIEEVRLQDREGRVHKLLDSYLD